ncbi:hypothetical protein EWO42_10220 [Salmonella enterica]|nr:hypothetical protein [Salmonella enterica]
MTPEDFAAEDALANCFLITGYTNILMYSYVIFNVTTPPDYVKFSRNRAGQQPTTRTNAARWRHSTGNFPADCPQSITQPDDRHKKARHLARLIDNSSGKIG